MVHTQPSSIVASRRAWRTLVGAVMIAGASCVPARPTPPPATPVASAPTPAPARPDSARVAGQSDSALARLRLRAFEGADLSPKPPVLPLSPSDEQKHLLLQAGYHMTPVLTEPAIQQPATISFDGNGRMFVLELRTYMLDADARDQLAPVSRISRWEDRDNDGVYETHTVFVDSLVFPRFATPYGADAILTMESNSNDVYKYTDTDGDGRADKKELFTTNFGRLANVEHLQSSLFWSMDNWLYSTVNQFRIRETPTGVIREPTGFNDAQWGATQDDDGKQWFQNGWLGVPGYFQVPIVYGTFTDSTRYEPDFDEIFGAPIGLADMQGGMPAVRKPDGSLAHGTAGSGANIYRGGRLPHDLLGDYFYGEVVGRVVRRARPIDEEGLVRVRNVYQGEKSEFIRSTDPLFRPVEIKSAPDGSMYVVDMYHGIIQESQWTPKGSYVRAKIEQYKLDRIVGLGRIWRITHESAKRDTTRPRMLSERPAQLVRHFHHPNGWWRDMAQQLLVLKKDRSIVPVLTRMVIRDTMLVARFHALWTLEGLGALDTSLVRVAMRDPNPRMRIQGIRASETLYKSGDTTLAGDWRTLTSDRSPDVVVQAMMTLNTLRVPDAATVVRATLASNYARGVQVIGKQILEPPAGVAGRNLTIAQRATLEKGAGIFRESCSSCHGANGLGAPVPGGTGTVAPALAGSPRVTGHPDYALNVLLHGLTGPIEGKTYAGQIMVSQAQQPDEWLAAIASYIRSTMTNQASFVTPEQVAAVRARTAARTTAWTYPELAAVVPQLMQQQSTWKATASHESDRAVRAFGTAGWSTVVPQQPGMWFQFELPEPVTLAELRFLSAPGFTPQGSPPRPATYPRGYRVQLSMDGTTWSEPVAEGQGTGPATVITLAPARTRFVRITQTATTESAPPWAIQQLQLYELRPERPLRSARASE
jgi:mono/diheme cytochrome c family protein/glucose/arabinose dehydrogenase